MGERTVRFSPNGGGKLRRRLPALPGDRGRVRLGQGGLADDADDPADRRRRRASRSRRCSARGAPAEAPVATEPILRRLSEPELAIVEAADLFNASQYRRTVGGIAKSLGDAARLDRAALGREPGRSWSRSPGRSPGTSTASRPDSAQPVRLAERGHEPDGARRGVHRVERAPGRGRPDRPGHRARLHGLRRSDRRLRA